LSIEPEVELLRHKVLWPLFTLIVIVLAPILALGQQAPSPYVPIEVPDTLAGLQAQVDELVRIARTHDQGNWQIALDTFSLPNPGSWFESNFAPEHIAQLRVDYPKVRDGHLGHISWVIGHNQDAPGFAIRVALSEMPSPPADSGFESLLPRPLQQVALQNFRFTPVANSGSTPPSWVSSYVYVDGHFRVVGGTYPFWSEGLTPYRGPMSLPATTLRNMTVQGIAYRKDTKGGPIVGIVQLEIKVERDGHVSKIKVLSGDQEYVEDAKTYIKSARFPEMPDIPQLANAERKWDFEVVFFKPKS
jgi:hypothetical protein